MFLRFSLACLLGLAAIGAPAAPREPVDLLVRARVEVGADGTVRSLEWRNELPVLKLIAERIEPAVRRWRFEPGRIDGVPVVTQTFISVSFRGEPGADGAMKLAFVSADTGPVTRKIVVPTYPGQAFSQDETGIVVAVVDFNQKGVPSVRSYDYHGKPKLEDAFVRAMREAVKQWKVELESVGGHPVAGSLRIPFRFCLSECPKLPGEKGNPLATDRAVALGSAVKLLDVRDPLAGG